MCIRGLNSDSLNFPSATDKGCRRKCPRQYTVGETIWEPAAVDPASIQRASRPLNTSRQFQSRPDAVGPDSPRRHGEEELQRRLLAGRYGEVRMLFFPGEGCFSLGGSMRRMGQRKPRLQHSAMIDPHSFVESAHDSHPGGGQGETGALGRGGLHIYFFSRHRPERPFRGTARF